ncbi:MAG: hypothetical protein ABEK01_04555, partial [Candidatus Nanohaloarchaea archaeon]
MIMASLVAGAFIYLSSRKIGGEMGKRFRILAVGTLFLAAYGILVGLQDAGVMLFSYRDGAFGVVHLLLHLGFSITTFIGFMSILKYARGGELW